jgi:hypothetical protein
MIFWGLPLIAHWETYVLAIGTIGGRLPHFVASNSTHRKLFTFAARSYNFLVKRVFDCISCRIFVLVNQISNLDTQGEHRHDRIIMR